MTKIYFLIHDTAAPYGTLTLLVSDNQAKLDDTVNFTCNIKEVTAYPEVSHIHWYKDKFKIRTTIPGEHLIIRHMDINGTGNYSCTVSNSLGESLHSDAVEVIVEVIVHEGKLCFVVKWYDIVMNL